MGGAEGYSNCGDISIMARRSRGLGGEEGDERYSGPSTL